MFGWRSGQASIEIGHSPYCVSSLLHPTQLLRETTIPLLHFLNCFNSLGRKRITMSQVQPPVAAVEGFFKRRVKALVCPLASTSSSDGGRLGVGDANRD